MSNESAVPLPMQSAPNAFGISQFTTWPWPFEQDMYEYAAAGATAIEIRKFKLDRADYAPQLEAIERANADRRNLGEGSIPTAEIISAVRHTGYDGSYVLEIFSEESLADSLWRGDIASCLRRNALVFGRLATEIFA
jgi:sugar phosphate isomerase/epimerase